LFAHFSFSEKGDIMLQTIRSLLFRRAKKTGRGNRPIVRSRPILEGLEDRNLLSITFSGVNNTGVATLTGTDKNDQFVVRLKTGDASTIEFSDNNGASFVDALLAGITSVAVSGLKGKDTLTLDFANGFIGQVTALPISFDGGLGRDTLVLKGTPTGTVTETFTIGSPGSPARLTVGNGTASTTVTLTNTERVTDTLTADTLTINGNDSNNFIHVKNGSKANGVVTDTVQALNVGDLDFADEQHSDNADSTLGDDNQDDGDDSNENQPPGDAGQRNGQSVAFSFANKTHLVVNGLGGDDLIVLSVSNPAAGLKTIAVDGGTGNNLLAGRSVPAGVTLTTTNIQRTDNDPDDIVIDELYHERLDRNAAATEVASWKNILHGAAGLNGVVRGIEESAEARTQRVKHFYSKLLGREAGGGEEQVFVNGMMQGATEEQIVAGILASAEFNTRAQSLIGSGTADERFVQALYQLVLNRPASSSEVAGWVNALNSLGRSGVALAFVESREFRIEMVTAFFTTLLHRQPDQGGLDFWISVNAGLEQIREGFMSSPEFHGNG
jgi:hypothetical protein